MRYSSNNNFDMEISKGVEMTSKAIAYNWKNIVFLHSEVENKFLTKLLSGYPYSQNLSASENFLI